MKTIATFILFGFSLGAFAQDAQNVTLLDLWSNDSIPPFQFDIRYNETWGFTHNGEEYGVIGSTSGTHILRLTDDDQLEEVAFVAGAFQGEVIHRDFDDYNGYLYAVCDQGASTLQIIDLSQLPDTAVVVYDSDEWVIRAHNVFIDTATSKLYLAGADVAPLRILSVENPTEPQFLADFNSVGYVHDLYARNDSVYLNCAGEGLRVVDFSNPASPIELGSLTTYPDQGYNHSGWLSEDGDTYVFADETVGMRMKVCDASDLSDIQVLGLFNSEVSPNSIPHNQQLIGDLVYVSHYSDGLQIFDISDRENPEKVAYYDTFPNDNDYVFNGAWGVYAFLPSGRILVSDRSSGLFLFRVDLNTGIADNNPKEQLQVFPNPTSGTVMLRSSIDQPHSVVVYNFSGQQVMEVPVTSNAQSGFSVDCSDLPAGMYILELVGREAVERGNLIKL